MRMGQNLISAQQARRQYEAAKAVIAWSVKWEEENSAPILTQTEDETLDRHQRYGAMLVACLTAGQESRQPGDM